MILTGPEIRRCVQDNQITIEPFEEEQVNPNSYDIRLGDQLLSYSSPVLDPKKMNPTETIDIPESGLVLEAGSFHVGHTFEWLGSDEFVALLHCKPEIAALGLFVHVTANLIDIGNHANFSYHLHAARSIRVYPRMRIAHVSFWMVQGQITLYSGKYKGSVGPMASRSFEHFKRTSDRSRGNAEVGGRSRSYQSIRASSGR